MPEGPRSYRRLIGPGIIAAGVGLASGEFILYPFGDLGDLRLWWQCERHRDRHAGGHRVDQILTLAPVVYVALEWAQMLKVAAVVVQIQTLFGD